MVPVAGRPFLEHLATQLLNAGLCPVVVAAGHLAAGIHSHFAGRPGWGDVKVVDTPLRGTGADLLYCLDQLPTEDLVVWNGDTVVDVDLAALLASVDQDAERGIIVLTRLPGVPNEQAFYVNHDGLVIADLEAEVPQAAPATYAWRGSSTGVVYLTKRLLAPFGCSPPAGLMTTLVPALVEHGRLRAFDNGTRYVLDFGTPERLAQLHHDAAAGRLPIG